MYKALRTILFFFPTEGVHHFSMKMLKLLCGFGMGRRLVEWCCRPEGAADGGPADGGRMPLEREPGVGPGTLEREVLGLRFRNPVGLGAGFDKNALYLRELEALGFGFVEIGTVTPRPQDGNEQPRLFRLPQDQGLINRMGFNNEGVEVISARLKERKESGVISKLIIGGNIGKNKLTPNEDAWK